MDLVSDTIAISGATLLVHGGAWDIPDDVLDDHRDGLVQAWDTGQAALETGDPALDVVTEVVAVLEGHGAFDAGCGSMLNQDGVAELDAGVMDGQTGAYGSVMATKRLRHPVQVARRLLDAGEGQVRMLAGEGAERFAAAEGFELVDNNTLVSDRERERYERLRDQAATVHTSDSFLPGAVDPKTGERLPDAGHDTVGCVVCDTDGHLAAATSTGGTPFKPPGRVGDSPLPGAGFYADEDVAVSCTGWGEAIAAVVLAHDIAGRIHRGTAAEPAARAALTRMHDRVTGPSGRGARGGCIVCTSTEAAIAYTTPRMARATDDGIRVG